MEYNVGDEVIVTRRFFWSPGGDYKVPVGTRGIICESGTSRKRLRLYGFPNCDWGIMPNTIRKLTPIELLAEAADA